MKDAITETTPTSSLLYENWRHFDAGGPVLGIQEARFYTDVRILGQVEGLGPYSFLNPVAQPRIRASNPLIPGIVFRVSYHVPADPHYKPLRDDFEHYHGGDMLDEIAALLSLFLGIRIKAGSVDREFSGSDPLGRPVAFSAKPEPHLFLRAPRRIARTGAQRQ